MGIEKDYSFSSDRFALRDGQLFVRDIASAEDRGTRDKSEGIGYSKGIWGIIMEFFGFAEEVTFPSNPGANSNLKGKAVTIYLSISDGENWINSHDPEHTVPREGRLVDRINKVIVNMQNSNL